MDNLARPPAVRPAYALGFRLSRLQYLEMLVLIGSYYCCGLIREEPGHRFQTLSQTRRKSAWFHENSSGIHRSLLESAWRDMQKGRPLHFLWRLTGLTRPCRGGHGKGGESRANNQCKNSNRATLFASSGGVIRSEKATPLRTSVKRPIMHFATHMQL
jgi:hypothetical protein